jgi:hypothetical protein
MSAICERQSRYIREMMERLGIELGGGVLPKFSLSYATALHRCESCPSKCACRKWLDNMPDSVSFAPPFCPNVDIFFELQVDQQGVAHITGEHVGDTWR